MPKVTSIQTQLNGGELSPKMNGRVDLDAYYHGCKVLRNFIPVVQGPAERRGGTGFVAQAKDTATASQIIPFKFSRTQAYIVELGDAIARFHLDRASVLETAKTITGATQANPVVITSAGHSFNNGDEVFISSVGGMTELNGRRFLVANQATNTFELTDLDGNNIDGTSYTAYTSGGDAQRVYTLTTPWAAADLADLKYAQSADVQYICHPDYQPRKLERTSATSFTLTAVDFQDGPYLGINTTTTTLTPSATSGSVTVTASATTGINGGDGFASTDVGRSIQFKDSGGNFKWLKITAFTSTTQVTATVESDTALASTTASTEWALGAWSDTTGWPSCAVLYESRLWFGGGKDSPLRLVGSRSGDFENMATKDEDGTVADDHAININLDADEVNNIDWLLDDEKALLAGSTGGVFVVRGSTTGTAITPTNVSARRTIATPASNIQPVKAANAGLFIEGGRKMREVAFVFEVDGFRAPDLTLPSEHITSPGITRMCYVRRPNPIIWMVRSDGTLVGCTYERDQEVVAWHRHDLGGFSDSGQTTAAAVESVASVPTSDGQNEELYLVVKRYINGQTRRYIEFLYPNFEDGDAQEDAKCLDSLLTYDGSAATTISGLWHLEGETISVLVDGAVFPDLTVSDGAITLTSAGSVVQAGYKYTSDLQLMGLEAGSRNGTAQGKRQRVNRLKVRMLNTSLIKAGADTSTLNSIPFRTTNDDLGSPPALYTGDKEIPLEDGYEENSAPFIRQDTPLPATIVAVIPETYTSDR